MRAVISVVSGTLRSVSARGGALALTTCLVLSYQNCSRVHFSPVAEAPSVALGPVDKPEMGSCGFEGTTAYDPTLFDGVHGSPDQYVSDFTRYVENILLQNPAPAPGLRPPTLRFSSGEVRPTDTDIFERKSSFSSPIFEDHWVRRARVLRMRNVVGNLWSSRVDRVEELRNQFANNLIRVWAKEIDRVEDLDVFPADLMNSNDPDSFLGIGAFRMTAIALRADRIHQAQDLTPWAGSLTVVARQIDRLKDANALHACIGFHSASKIENVVSPLIRLQGNKNREGDLAFAHEIKGLYSRSYGMGTSLGTAESEFVQTLTNFTEAILGAERGVEIVEMRIDDLSEVQSPRTLLRHVEINYAHDISGDLIVDEGSVIHRLEKLSGRLILRRNGIVHIVPEGVEVIRE
jgi:hypothetical protein